MQSVATAAQMAVQDLRRDDRSAGDAAFTEMFEKYYTKVFAFVYSRVRHVDLTKDIVSEIFERAYLKGHLVRDPGAYSAWLFMIAKNTIAGHFRRQRRECNYRDKVGEGLRLAGEPPQPEDFALRDERIGQLQKHMRMLPQRDQELLSLKYDAELSHVEIAKVLGMTPLNVRVSIFRALKRLRTRMEQEAASWSAVA